MNLFWYFLVVISCTNFSPSTAISSKKNDPHHHETDFTFNFTHIVFQSILFCGPEIICNKSLLAAFNISYLPYYGTNRCGSCSCKEACAFYRSPDNCCPDIYYRHGLRECLDLKVVSEEKFNFEVIASCPVGSDEYLSKECSKRRSMVQLLLGPPATSSKLGVAYLNEHCAKCNRVSELSKWKVEFRCTRETDFNYLSTYQEIIDLAINESCSVIYNSSSTFSCVIKSDQYISACNVSGSWSKYDKQTDKACRSSYSSPIGVFKNIFCAICNPAEFEQSLMIVDCLNASSDYYNACLIFPSLEASRPYKNYFCFECNLDGNNSVFFKDVIFQSASEVYSIDAESKHHPFKITISFAFHDGKINNIANEFIKTFNSADTIISSATKDKVIVQKSQTTCKTVSEKIVTTSTVPDIYPTSKTSFTFIKRPYINNSNLILSSFAFSLHGACAPGLIPRYIKYLELSCSCSIGCESDCCDDFALQQPWACIGNHYHRDSTDKDLKAIGGCLENPILEPLCSGKPVSSFYQAFPVNSLNGYFESYVNIFCYLCNQKKRKYDNVQLNVNAWPLVLDCKHFLNYRNFPSLQSFIDYANISSCLLTFLPPSTVSKCKDKCRVNQIKPIEKCNTSGTWLTFNEDVLHACEYTEIFRFPMININNLTYKNKFCKICNPFDSTPLDNDCSDFQENSSVAKACSQFPSIKACYPFKNILCEICYHDDTNSNCFSKMLVGVEPTISPDLPSLATAYHKEIGTFRTTFTLHAYDSPNQEHQPSIVCEQHQMFDPFMQTCKDITCYPGKHLVNDTCVFLLPFSSKLLYTLSLKIEFPTPAYFYMTVGGVLDIAENYISYTFKNTLNAEVYIEDLILMGTEDCWKYRLQEVYLYLTIFIKSNVDRKEIEESLLGFTESSSGLAKIFESFMNLPSPEKVVNVSNSLHSMFLPSLLTKFDKKTNCFLVVKNDPRRKTLIRNVRLSPLLSCKQVTLQSNEFGVDWRNIRTDFLFPDMNISANLYESTNDGRIRICIEDLLPFIRMFNKTVSMETDISSLGFLTVACIGISLMSLAMTFVTYSIFPRLRSIPGSNNMCLVASLFTAQLLMIARPIFNSIGLEIVSALSHFFWLATFFWLQVCSFHMYRVFSAKSRSTFHRNQGRKIIAHYGLYAFGGAALIVGVNIISTLLVSEYKLSGYDKTSTLLTYKIAFIITLIVPLIFMCVTNIFFYILTAYELFSVPDVEKETGNRLHFSVYVKLFSLTGLSWLLQIVDIFVELSFFTYIVAVLNGLQGFVIFVSYVCNKRTWKMYADVCCKKNSQNTLSNISINTENTTI